LSGEEPELLAKITQFVVLVASVTCRAASRAAGFLLGRRRGRGAGVVSRPGLGAVAVSRAIRRGKPFAVIRPARAVASVPALAIVGGDAVIVASAGARATAVRSRPARRAVLGVGAAGLVVATAMVAVMAPGTAVTAAVNAAAPGAVIVDRAAAPVRGAG